MNDLDLKRVGKAERALFERMVKHKTNYDRIISKTPEELAKWIAGIYPDCPPGFSPAPLGCDDVCAECWLEWLKGEAEPC